MRENGFGRGARTRHLFCCAVTFGFFLKASYIPSSDFESVCNWSPSHVFFLTFLTVHALLFIFALCFWTRSHSPLYMYIGSSIWSSCSTVRLYLYSPFLVPSRWFELAPVLIWSLKIVLIIDYGNHHPRWKAVVLWWNASWIADPNTHFLNMLGPSIVVRTCKCAEVIEPHIWKFRQWDSWPKKWGTRTCHACGLLWPSIQVHLCSFFPFPISVVLDCPIECPSRHGETTRSHRTNGSPRTSRSKPISGECIQIEKRLNTVYQRELRWQKNLFLYWHKGSSC